MRYEDAVKIEQLASSEYDARLRCDALRTRNVVNLSPEEVKALYVELQLAEAEHSRLHGLLLSAQGRMFSIGRLGD